MAYGRENSYSLYIRMTMSEVLYRATKYMNAEDALLAREDKPRKRERLEVAHQDQGRRNQGWETDAMKGIPSTQEEDLHASLP